MLAEGDIEVVNGLSRAGPDGNEWSRIIEWAYVNGIAFAVDLRGKKADAAGHLLDTADLADKGPLEGVYIGVELKTKGSG